MKHVLNRRTLLRGLGGAAIGLPLLDAMIPLGRASASTLVGSRFVFGFGGISMGINDGHDLMTPAETGREYVLTPAALALEAVRDHVSLITGLEIPVVANATEPGSCIPKFHSATISPLLSGVRSHRSNSSKPPQGVTADTIANASLSRGRPTHARSLALGVQATGYRANDDRGYISWFENGAGDLQANVPLRSPRSVWNRLFRDKATSGTDLAAWQENQNKRKSVLDLVKDNADALSRKLGPTDRRRLDQHLTEIRSLERQLNEASPPDEESACIPPLDPGPDPETVKTSYSTGSGAKKKNHQTGWSGETERGLLLNDYIRMAFICDDYVSVSLCYTFIQTFLGSAQVVTNGQSDFHQTSHTSAGNANLAARNNPKMAACINWHCMLFADLIQKLANTEEGEGSLLDSTAAVLVFEGGHGQDAEKKNEKNSPHSAENMTAIIAGHAGGLQQGQHVRKKGTHPAQAIATGLQAVGAGDRLGEIHGVVPELF